MWEFHSKISQVVSTSIILCLGGLVKEVLKNRHRLKVYRIKPVWPRVSPVLWGFRVLGFYDFGLGVWG